MRPIVSVIINTFNRPKLLIERAVRSVENQTFKDWELLVVDGSAGDETERTLEDIKDDRIHYLRREDHGTSDARNYGIEQARGEYIAFTDDDDEFLPSYLETAIQKFKTLPPNIDFLSGSAYLRDDYGVTTYLKVPLEPFWRCPVGNGWIFRARVFRGTNIRFDTKLKAEDLDLRQQITKAGHHGIILDEPLRVYYVRLKYGKERKESLSVNMVHHARAFEQFFEKHEEFYKKAGKDAIAWLYYWGGLSNARAGNMGRARMFFRKSLRAEFSIQASGYLILSLFGHKTFEMLDKIKSRIMRVIRVGLGLFSVSYLKELYKKTFLYRLFPPTYEWYKRDLVEVSKGTTSILDIGCGYNSFLKYVDPKIHKVGVDLFDPYLAESAVERIHSEYVKQDIRDLSQFKNKSLDMTMASDVIEHLTKEEGHNLIKDMERIARKRVIIYTPNGFLPQKSYDDNNLQEHKSGWTVEEFRRMGYEVRGMDGWKFVRGEESKIKFWPKPFWTFVSNLSEYFVYRHPEKAHALFCVKYL